MEKVYTIILFDSALNAKVHVNVSKDVFDEYRRGIWRIHKNNVKHSDDIILFSELKGGEEDAYENFHEFDDNDENPAAVFENATKKKKLREVILSLRSDEQKLINALFFDGLTASEYARKINKTPQNVSQRKKCILKKIKKFLEK